MILNELLLYVRKKLSMFPNSNLESEQLICYVFGYSKLQLLLNLQTVITYKEFKTITFFVKRRCLLEPISYILGYKYFWKSKFFVDFQVLIPRSDTELIILLLCKLLFRYRSYNFLDLGTGSGCIILSIAQEFINSRLFATDICSRALRIAKHNAMMLYLSSRVKFIKSNWFNSIYPVQKFDVIIANPPYISINQYINLNASVKRYEPRLALTDEKDGLENYRIIISGAPFYLKPQGILVLEIGYNQEHMLRKLLSNKNATFYKDINNITRVAIVKF